jgi:transmembrane 9 superfamily member 2/4
MEYYGLPYCQPVAGPVMDHQNFGQYLAGDRIQSSPYILKMKQDMFCEQLCVSHLGRTDGPFRTPNKSVKAIRQNYHNNWIVDNLPAASKLKNDWQTEIQYFQGFPVGFVSDDKARKAYINNHVNIEIMYHNAMEYQTDGFRVVRFTIEPFSIHHEIDQGAEIEWYGKKLPIIINLTNPIPSCDRTKAVYEHTKYDMISNIITQKPQEASGLVLFTYDVIWIENKDLLWASRWDVYLNMDNMIPAQVHWYSILNSIVLVILLLVLIVVCVVRNLRRDMNRYNEVAADEGACSEEVQECDGNSLYASVFRPPSFSPMLLAVGCGTGAQLLFATLLTIVFSTLGFIKPAHRGLLRMSEVYFFVLMGILNGYVTSYFYKMFEGKVWQQAAAWAAFGLPGAFSLYFLILNFVALAVGSTAAVPLATILVLLVLWFGISTPLVFLGAYLGNQQDAINFPAPTSSIHRQVPDQPWYTRFPFTLTIGGILPFVSCFVELFYIMSSVWLELYYDSFGFLLAVFTLSIITCAEVTVMLTYSQLHIGDCRWWWSSFCNGGSVAIYVFLYSVYYVYFVEPLNWASYVLYFGYMGFVSCGLFSMMGFVGLTASLWFNMTIFKAKKN